MKNANGRITAILSLKIETQKAKLRFLQAICSTVADSCIKISNQIKGKENGLTDQSPEFMSHHPITNLSNHPVENFPDSEISQG